MAFQRRLRGGASLRLGQKLERPCGVTVLMMTIDEVVRGGRTHVFKERAKKESRFWFWFQFLVVLLTSCLSQTLHFFCSWKLLERWNY